MRLKVGTQIAYIPTHAKSDLNHPDVQFGFVTAVNEPRGYAQCRYWRARGNFVLRTKGNSENTPIGLLVRHISLSQVAVDELLYTLKYIDAAELATRKMGL